MCGLKLIWLRVGLLGGLVVAMDLVLANEIWRDLVVLSGQLVVEWLLLDAHSVTRWARRLNAVLRRVVSEPSTEGDDE